MPREFTSFNALFQTMQNDVEHRLHNAEHVMHKAGEVVKTHAQGQLGHYLTESGPFPGEPWAQLAASTLERKAHDTPLVETGALHDAIEVTATHNEAFIGVKSEIGEHGVDVGDIAYWQEFGTLNNGGHIPPRPFLGPALHDNEKEIAEQIAAGLFVDLSIRR